ncbi:GNAT family N-acetyltransferase [Robertmurraya yapensis]|uniref:GNAT family N-acetyltransferase n=1 Tax=Bacillus yapensis TaxID=2492960 RepID=A0A431WEX8_9BACI|nr:GNAT family N-acetyltransferase [Bacillus yapensis]RTR34092.1 GNAT family N-acetyltransferase [Bacillus yapensis]TKS97410.1 GNAT family N-acetyltransferase [Bacillus yapensis]
MIRQASTADVPQLKDLMLSYIVDFYHQQKPNEDELVGLIHHLINNPSSGLQFVAEENGELLGFSTLYFTFSTLKVKKAAILNDLFVSPSARGIKIGEALFQKNVDYIRANDFASMTWETAKDNVVAQGLYNKMGGQLSEWLVYEIH